LLYGNRGLRIADNDTLYIADKSNHRIVVIRSGSRNASQIIGNGSGSGVAQMNNPSDVFVTNDAVFVLDSGNYRVVKYFKNGTNPIVIAGNTGAVGTTSSNRTFGTSWQLFVDVYGSIYVSDQSNNRVLRFPPNSLNGTTASIVAGTGASGTAPMQLNTPGGVFVDDSLTVFIADTNNHRIQKWKFAACRGETVAGKVSNGGSTLSQLSSPSSIVVDSNGCLYISDAGNNRILRWATGASVGECISGCSGGAGSSYYQLNSPFTVAFDSQGSLYVSDASNNRVQKFLTIPTTGEDDLLEKNRGH
jgi:sugar lactone lactonase YvrE